DGLVSDRDALVDGSFNLELREDGGPTDARRLPRAWAVRNRANPDGVVGEEGSGRRGVVAAPCRLGCRDHGRGVRALVLCVDADGYGDDEHQGECQSEGRDLVTSAAHNSPFS